MPSASNYNCTGEEFTVILQELSPFSQSSTTKASKRKVSEYQDLLTGSSYYKSLPEKKIRKKKNKEGSGKEMLPKNCRK